MWGGVPLDPPGATLRTFRLTNLRVDATVVPPDEDTSVAPVRAVVSLSGAAAPPLDNATRTVGFVQSGAEVSVRDAVAAAVLAAPVPPLQCRGGTNQRIATLRFVEGFPTSFRRRTIASTFQDPLTPGAQDVTGTIYNTESMLFRPTLEGHPARGDLASAGLADFGTRLAAEFTDVPAGVVLYVDTSATGGDHRTRLTASEAGAFSGVGESDDGPTGTAAVPLVNGRGTAVWEVTDDGAIQSGTLDFGVYATWATAMSPLGTATVRARLAPNGDTTIPRFAGGGTDVPLLAVVADAECDAQCGGPCDDGDTCTGFEACNPGVGCVSPATLTGFALARCEIARLQSPVVCGSETLDKKLAKVLQKKTAKALSFLDRAEPAAGKRRLRILRNGGRELGPIQKTAKRRKRVSDGCRTTLAGLVGVARQKVAALQTP